MQKTIVTIKVIIAIAIMGFTGCGAGFDDDSGDQNPTVPWKGTAQLGSAARDWAYAAATDSSGNIYVAGNTEGDFDGNPNGGSYDCFLVKYNAAGEKEWSRQFGASLDESAFGVATDSKGNIYVTGCTGDSLDLDGNANSGGRDIFLVKFTPAGVREWSRYLGGTGNDQGLAVTVDCIDNIYITGRTTSSLPGSDTAHSGGTGYDIFLAQYNSLGGCNKVTQAGTTSDDQGWGIAADSAGNVYITGFAEGGLLANSLIGGSDIVLLKYDANVTLDWTTQIGTSNDEIAYSVSIDSLGNNYITGSSRGDLGGSKDVFLVKHNSDGV
ncbi:MAG: hypothetical protein GY765_23025, partial [bacterium]|nr:hypothetical protein [bacterium]